MLHSVWCHSQNYSGFYHGFEDRNLVFRLIQNRHKTKNDREVFESSLCPVQHFAVRLHILSIFFVCSQRVWLCMDLKV